MAASLNKKLQGKVAIVTGGASGIGEATARLFITHGARAVVIADIHDAKGYSVAESIGSDHCSYFQCDVTDEEQVKSLVDWTTQTYGGLDVLFNSAGIMTSPIQSIMDLDLSVFDKVMSINARGTAVTVKHTARKMVELGTPGAIVCVASVAVVVGNPANVDYSMSKHAVVGLMQSSFQNLGQHGIRINCVSPSLVPTAMAEGIGLASPEAVQMVVGPVTSLKGVTLTAEHVAEAVSFLASDEAAFVTGHNLVLDGGVSIYAVLQAMAAHSHK